VSITREPETLDAGLPADILEPARHAAIELERRLQTLKATAEAIETTPAPDPMILTRSIRRTAAYGATCMWFTFWAGVLSGPAIWRLIETHA
jgi:hypothetical protein